MELLDWMDWAVARWGTEALMAMAEQAQWGRNHRNEPNVEGHHHHHNETHAD